MRNWLARSWRIHMMASLKAHHRGLIWTLEAIAFVLAGVVIMLAAAAYRLEQGPIDVKFLTPQLVAWLDHQVAPLQVVVDDTSLRWSAGDSELQIYIAGVGLTDRTGDVIATVPSVEFSLSLRSLLFGQVRPTIVTIENPNVRLQRGPEGNFYIHPGPAPAASPLPPLQEVIDDLDALVQRDRELSGTNRELRAVRLRDGTVWIDDQQISKPWQIAGLNVEIDRSAPRYLTSFRADVAAAGEKAHLAGTVHFDVGTLQSDYRVALDPIVPTHWAAFLSPDSAAGKAPDFPVAAVISGHVDLARGVIGPVGFDADLQAGQLLDPRLEQGRFAFRKAKVTGSFDLVAGLLKIDHAGVDLGGPTVDGSVTLTQVGRATQAAPSLFGLDLAIHHMPRSGMESDWPAILMPKTRAWVLDHVKAGELAELTLKALWEIHPELPRPFVKKKLDGTMKFKDITLDYLHGLVPAVGMEATARLDLEKITFDASQARLDTIGLRHGTAVIDGLNQPDAPSIMTLNLDLAGPARDAITFLAAPRMHLADKIGIAPGDISGTFEGPVEIRFPILKTGDTPVDEIEYHGKLHLTEAGLIKGALGRDLGNGDVFVSFDRQHVEIAGTAEIATVPARLNWTDFFAASSRVRSRLHVEASVNDDGRSHLALDPLPGAIHGPVGVIVDATVDRTKSTLANIRLDLADADVNLAEANWHKEPGLPATMTMVATIQDGRWRRIRNMDAQGPAMDFQGELDFDNSGAVSRASSRHFKVGASDAVGLIAHDDLGWHVDLSGNAIDAAGYVDRFDKPSTPAERAKAPPVAVTISAGTLMLGPGRIMKSAQFRGDFLHAALQQGDLKAQIGEKGSLTFHLDSADAGCKLLIVTDDMGAAAKVINLSTHVAGGTAAIRGGCIRIDGTRHFTGRLEAKDCRLVQAPVLAKILSLSSFSSIASLLDGEGVPFAELSADLALTDGTMLINHGRAFGDAIGLVAEGQYDFNSKQIALNGTLVPAYFLNGILGDLPVVGKLLAGGAGEGLFGANFKVGGAVSEPKITTNPLSILAPGPLRDLFLFQAPRPSPASGSNPSQPPATGGKP
jgi:AsmA-like C-terminal region/Protein of unknown function